MPVQAELVADDGDQRGEREQEGDPLHPPMLRSTGRRINSDA
jgi:hypothetical protein